MEPSTLYRNHRGSQDDERDADGNGADGPDSEDCTDLSSGISCDSSSSYDSEVNVNEYTCNLEVYTGNLSNKPEHNHSESIVLKLAKHLLKKVPPSMLIISILLYH